MENSTQLNATTTNQVNTIFQIVFTTVSLMMVLLFIIFMYFMVIILNVFFTNPQVRETARYILFIHMLFNDLAYLVVTFLVFLCTIFVISVPLPICYIYIMFSACSFYITPYNLAVMSLERYSAICYPLRHAELWTAHRTISTIASMWMLVMISPIADFIIFCVSVDKSIFSFSFICYWKLLNVNRAQEIIKTLTNVLSFSLVGMIITFTYTKVILVARKMDSEKFASKAGKTVLLHAFQLFLSMLSFTTSLSEAYLAPSIRYLAIINFFLFMCLPRFINPLIYGIRDEVFGKPMRFYFTVRI